MSVAAAMLASAAQKDANRPQNTRRPGFDYRKVLLDKVQGVWQLTSIRQVVDTRYGEVKLAFLFVHIIPGAEAAETEEAQREFQEQGHGKMLSIEVRPIVSPPGRRKNAKTGAEEAISASNMYNVLSVLINNGDPLTKEQLGIADPATVKAWVADYNAAIGRQDFENVAAMLGSTVEEVQAEGGHPGIVTDAEMMKRLYAAGVTGRQLMELRTRKPFVYATPEVKVKTDKDGQAVKGEDGKPIKSNRLRAIDSLVPEKAIKKLGLVDYKPYPRPMDPREKDDEVIHCEATGERIRGYENNKGEWVTARQAADHSRETYGGAFCGRHIAQLKRAALAEGSGEVAPF